jgi:EF hand
MITCGKTQPYDGVTSQPVSKRDWDYPEDETSIALMALLDINGDNSISWAEYQAWAFYQVGQLIAPPFYTTPNLTISLVTVLGNYMSLFDKADLDGNGYLNATEVWSKVSSS